MTPETPSWWLAASAVAVAGLHASAAGAAAPTEGRTMDPYPPLYAFVQQGLSVALVRIERVQHRPGPGSEEIVELALQVVEPWWRPPSDGGPFHYTYRQPAARNAQLKFPHPVWGRVEPAVGTLLLLAWRPGAREPVYVDTVDDPSAAAPAAARALLAGERQGGSADSRVPRRLAQLRGIALEKLYAGEALAHHRGAFSAAQQAQVADAMTRAYAEEREPYVKISLGTWLWEPLYRKFSRTGRTQVLNAMLATAAAEPDGQVRTQALDRLALAEPAQLRERDIVVPPQALAPLAQRLAAETDAGSRRHIEEVLAALRR